MQATDIAYRRITNKWRVMKTQMLKIASVFVVITLLFAACDTPNKVNNTETEQSNHLELNIPDGFNFETTQKVDVTFSAAGMGADGALVEIYNANPEKGGSVIERLYVRGGANQLATLNIPTYLENLWFISRDTNGNVVRDQIAVTGNSLHAEIPAVASMSSSGLVARYLFNEGTGTEVIDQSGFGSPLNLEFGSGVDWLAGRNGVEITSASAIIRSNVAATKVYDELTSSNEFTIEAWGKPANLSQTGPARIVSMSDGSSNRNFTLGQGPFGGSGEDIEFRLRTTTTNNNAFPGHIFSDVVTLDESHYVVTWDGNELRYYQDGVHEGTFPTTGDLSNWNAGYELIFGNETDLTRPWLGELYQVSIYSEALDETQIQDNFADGSLIPFIYTFDNPFPAEDEFATLAYEDLWPSFGDYDFNDLVVDYNIVEETDLDNLIHKIRFSFAIRALGAAFDSGFGVEFPVPYGRVSEVTGTRYTKGLVNTLASGVEDGHANAVVMMWDDSAHEMGKWVNTTNPSQHVDEDSLFITVSFDPPVSRMELGTAPYKPFAFIENDRGREVHLPGNEPTVLADPGFFGTFDDDSDPSMGRYYLSVTDLNWAFNIPESIPYPLEKVSILEAYPDFKDWAESGGMVNQDWYLPANRDNSKLYFKP